MICLRSEHSYGTTRDSEDEDAEPENGERLDHPYSAPQVSRFYLNYKSKFERENKMVQVNTDAVNWICFVRTQG